MLRIKTCVCGFVDNLNLEILTEKDMYKTTQFNVTTMLTGPKYLRFYKKNRFHWYKIRLLPDVVAILYCIIRVSKQIFCFSKIKSLT